MNLNLKTKNMAFELVSGTLSIIAVVGIVVAGVALILAVVGIALSETKATAAAAATGVKETASSIAAVPFFNGSAPSTAAILNADVDILKTGNLVTLRLKGATATPVAPAGTLITLAVLDASLRPLTNVNFTSVVTNGGIDQIIGYVGVNADGTISVAPYGQNGSQQALANYALTNPIGWTVDISVTYSLL